MYIEACKRLPGMCISLESTKHLQRVIRRNRGVRREKTKRWTECNIQRGMQAIEIPPSEGIPGWLLFYRKLPGESVIVDEDVLMMIYNI